MPWYRHLLWPLALLYGFVVGIRNWLFNLGVLKSTKFDIPVICIGNLETGGTGKSPLVLNTIGILANSGLKPVLLSRGYGRDTKGFLEVHSTDKAIEVGDEPLQAKLRFPQIPVVVCEDRVKAIRKIISDFDVDVVVMDDGFQHRWVKPSLSVLATRSEFPFWENQLLPVGTLRESKSAYNRSDAVVLTSGSRKASSLNKPVYSSLITNQGLVQVSGVSKPVNTVKSVLLVSGIANPSRFKDAMSKDFTVLEHTEFSDHHAYSRTDIELLLKKIDSFGTSADAVVITEKDAARLANTQLLDILKDTPVFYLRISLEFDPKDAEEFEKLIVDNGKYVR